MSQTHNRKYFRIIFSNEMTTSKFIDLHKEAAERLDNNEEAINISLENSQDEES